MGVRLPARRGGCAAEAGCQTRWETVQKPVTLDSDLTTELATFNADKPKPLALGGKIVGTPTEADFSATITRLDAGRETSETRLW